MPFKPSQHNRFQSSQIKKLAINNFVSSILPLNSIPLIA